MRAASEPPSTALSREPIRYLTDPLQRFLLIEAADGAILLIAAVFALSVANSPLGSAYLAFWQKIVGVHIGTALFLLWVQSISHLRSLMFDCARTLSSV